MSTNIIGILILISLFLIVSSKGMRNSYSLSLLIIMNTLIATGSIAVVNEKYWGVALILLGSMFICGFKTIQGSKPRKVGLITYFGERTETVVEGLTLLLDYPFSIIDVSEFEIQISNIDTPITSVRSFDGVRFGGLVSAGIIPDENNLDKFDDAKGIEGIESIVSENILSWMQEIGKEPKHTWSWMESHTSEIRKLLMAKLEGEDDSDHNDNNPRLNAKDLGFLIKKLDVKLTPINIDVIKADEESQIEELQRISEMKEMATIEAQVLKRMEMYETWEAKKPGAGRTIPSLADCMKEVFEQRLARDKRVTAIKNSGGGRNINLTNVGGS